MHRGGMDNIDVRLGNSVRSFLCGVAASCMVSAIPSVPQVWQAAAVSVHAISNMPCKADRSLSICLEKKSQSHLCKGYIHYR